MTPDDPGPNEVTDDPGPTNTPGERDPGPTNDDVDERPDRAHEADAAEADPEPTGEE